MQEYLESGAIEELADILEVVYGIARYKGFSRIKLEKLRQEEKKERGSFDKKIFLIETPD